jgi:hypothetical protein
MRFSTILALTGAIVFFATPVLASPARQPKAQPTPGVQDGREAIPLPKDLTDNSDPFVSGPSGADDKGTNYFREQQNFRDQNPTRTQESDRVIRQFE